MARLRGIKPCDAGAPAAPAPPIPLPPTRLYATSSGFFTRPGIAAILRGAGHDLRAWPALSPAPAGGAALASWGRGPRAWRAEWAQGCSHLPIWRIEDAFLRSVHPGRARASAPLGLLIDDLGLHHEPGAPARIEAILQGADLDAPALLQRASDNMARIQALELSKYNNFDPSLAAPRPGYVLLVDQCQGDAALGGPAAHPQARAQFHAMLATAQHEHPGAPIVIRSHPETDAGLRGGHFSAGDLAVARARPGAGPIQLCSAALSPWRLLAGARAVYCISSQLGFEAILAGHRPQLFGQPFYAGWGLSCDRAGAPQRRQRRLSPAQLFAGAMLLAPTWHDPCRDRPCDLEQVIDQLEAERRAWREDRAGYLAGGMRRWKRPFLRRFFGQAAGIQFAPARMDLAQASAQAQAQGRALIWWASRLPDMPPNPPQNPVQTGPLPLPAAGLIRIEDGFLRSRGLGARLVAPMSLIRDDLGCHYDPRAPSRLEALIPRPLSPPETARAQALIAAICAGNITKYMQNSEGAPQLSPLPPGGGAFVLAPGQVEDDAALRLGAPGLSTRDLLRAARRANPGKPLIFKPHPDVLAGLRPGLSGPEALAEGLADQIATGDPSALMVPGCAVWTLSSGLGFEALLRGCLVTCLGLPFYAGWGLTTDLAPAPPRRQAAGPVSLAQLAHAALIAYPRYHDPVSNRPCPPEVILDRLAAGRGAQPRGLLMAALALAQDRLARHSGLWRR